MSIFLRTSVGPTVGAKRFVCMERRIEFLPQFLYVPELEFGIGGVVFLGILFQDSFQLDSEDIEIINSRWEWSAMTGNGVRFTYLFEAPWAHHRLASCR